MAMQAAMSTPTTTQAATPAKIPPSARFKIALLCIEDARQNINWAVMPGDHMMAQNQVHYSDVGELAMRVIFAAQILANSAPPKTVLDFACGSGRVTRWLRAMYPAAEIWVSDVREDSLKFCAEAFDVENWLSNADISTVEAPQSFDLIWSGSLLTHLSEEKCRLLFKKFRDWLAPGGLCVVTTHGRRVVSNMISKKQKYIPIERNEEVLAELASKGFSYVPYGNQPVGFSVNTLDWLQHTTAELGVRMIAMSENAWVQSPGRRGVPTHVAARTEDWRSRSLHAIRDLVLFEIRFHPVVIAREVALEQLEPRRRIKLRKIRERVQFRIADHWNGKCLRQFF